MAVGTGPAIITIRATALRRAPARPAGKPARPTGALYELLASGREMGPDLASAAAGHGRALAPHSMRRVNNYPARGAGTRQAASAGRPDMTEFGLKSRPPRSGKGGAVDVS